MSTSSLDRFDRPARFGGVLTFGLLFALESFVRSLNSTVVSLQTYDLLGTSQRVSMLMTGVSVVVLATGLSVPLLLARIPRRWGYTLGVLCLIAGSAALMANVVASQAFGIYFRNIGASLLNVTLALYILDHVRRFDLARVESARLSLSTLSWTAGPPLGVMLYTNYGAAVPQLVALAAAAALLALFWYLRLNDHGILRPARSSPPDPLANIGRFVAQPRLRLAWLIAFGRSCFWLTFFVYSPLLLVEAGAARGTAGWLVAASQLLLGTAYLFGRLARRIGIRTVIATSHAAIGVTAILAGLAGLGHPGFASALLLVAALAAVALDGVGGIPFLRAVRARERAEMASVYRTYIDLSDLIPSFIFSIVLGFFEIGSVFVIMGAAQFAIALTAWHYLPKSLK